MIGKKFKKIGIICHDAGSANIIINWIKYYKKKYIIRVDGPAKKIFERVLKKKKINHKLEKIIQNSDLIITGTSNISSLENRARMIALQKKKKVIAVLDHWVFFRERFIYQNKVLLPNEIWVTNKFAYALVKKKFKHVNVKLKKNILEKLIAKVKATKVRKIRNYLYFLEPINNSVEFVALKKFHLFLKKNNISNNISIIFKLHPREKINKYKKILNIFNKYNYKIISDIDLVQLFSWAQIILGLRSYALVLGIKTKKPLFSLLPIKNFKTTLPYKIKNLFNINKKELLYLQK